MNKNRIIPLSELASIVKREITNSALRESVDHEQISAVVSSASKLASAIKKFQADAPETAVGSLSTQLAGALQTLDDMVTNPASYVARVKKTVRLAPVVDKS